MYFSKSVCAQAHEGSNPSLSAKARRDANRRSVFALLRLVERTLLLRSKIGFAFEPKAVWELAHKRLGEESSNPQGFEYLSHLRLRYFLTQKAPKRVPFLRWRRERRLRTLPCESKARVRIRRPEIGRGRRLRRPAKTTKQNGLSRAPAPTVRRRACESSNPLADLNTSLI